MNKRLATLLALLALCAGAFQSHAFSLLSTGFTYQGRLNDGASPANGTYDLVFTAYDAADPSGIVIAGPVTNTATVVSNGVFTVTVDFGTNTPTVFNFSERWLEIGARTNSAGSFSTLTPRQRVSATPYAWAAVNAAALLGNLPASQVQGTLSLAQLPAEVLTNNQTGVTLSGTFSGNGAGLTNLNAVTIGGVGSNGFWQATGNAGTIAGASFIGTTDNQPLDVRVNNTRAFRIEPTSVPSLEGGYFQNSTHGFTSAAIVGGGTSGSINEIFGDYGFIGAGHGAKVGSFSAIVDGAYNDANAQFSFIGSGYSNTNQGIYSFIGSGTNNSIQSSSIASAIGGGRQNVIRNANPDPFFLPAGYDFIGGGWSNFVSGSAMTIGGGYENKITGDASTIGGGELNFVSGGFGSTIAGGFTNVILSAFSSTIGGGQQNIVAANSSTIAGGVLNFANGIDSTIGGGFNNTNTSAEGTIAGGNGNTIGGVGAVIGGGLKNTAIALGATISGGQNNNAAGANAAIAGGKNNIADGNATSVSGGSENHASGDHSSIGGGQGNFVNGYGAAVGGGVNNQATNDYAAVPGGFQNVASGIYSLAAGFSAQALHEGSFVWADSQNASFSSTISNQFNVRAGNGLRVSDGLNGNIVMQDLQGANGDGYQSLNFNGYYDQSLGTEQRFNGTKTRWRLVVDQRNATDLMTIDNFNGTTVSNLVAITTGGNVGIGNNAPSQLLQLGVTAGHGEGMEIDSGIAGDSPAIYLNHNGNLGRKFRIASYGDNSSNGSLRIRDETAGVYRITMDSAGNVGIGTTIPDNLLTVNGSADKPGGGSWGTFSDARLKDVGDNFTNGMEALENIQPIHYHYKSDNALSLPAQPEYIGVVAQEVERAVPEAVEHSKTGYLVVNNDPIFWTTVNAVKSLHQQLEHNSLQSESRIQKLEAENAALKARLEKIERLMEAKLAGYSAATDASQH